MMSSTVWLVLSLLALSDAQFLGNLAGQIGNFFNPASSASAPQKRQTGNCATVDGSINTCSYENHEQLLRFLRDLEQRHPNLVRVGSIGRSTEGRDIAFVRITSNIREGDRALGKPMFKWVGNMHGDEVVGRQMLKYLSQYLSEQYGKNPRVTKLLDTTEITILPTMNPDGYAKSVPRCGMAQRLTGLFTTTGRENANGVDLNRDFPKQFDEPQDVPLGRLSAGRQQETVLMMRHIVENPYVLSANLHGGAVVASYPFDDSPIHRSNFYSAAPDDAVFKRLASIYADNHASMASGNHCGDRFPGGITNGADWYDVAGGMQDFNYVHSNAFEITLELSCCKHPSVDQLAEEWFNNKESMMRYMEATHMGVKGLVVDETGNPVANARIVVDGISKTVSTTGRGEYWRLLVPGVYNVHAEASGYAPSRSVQVRVVERNPPVAEIQNFSLNRL